VDKNSLTFLIHGSRTKWEGNIGYNDNHVNFETTLDAGATYTGAGGKKRPDLLFLDEPDFPDNNFLGIFTTAGPERKDFTSIWD
jgi:hypothetical protein